VSVVFTNGSAACRPVLTLGRAPMRVAITPLGVDRWPLAPVLDQIGQLLGTQP